MKQPDGLIQRRAHKHTLSTRRTSAAIADHMLAVRPKPAIMHAQPASMMNKGLPKIAQHVYCMARRPRTRCGFPLCVESVGANQLRSVA
ncbi:hypothetical protein P4N68_02230 [Corynebacterium felinum]|uniref:Uncharacterized protein n=1 Tax=Corynebacterium felinum TaxID=131318 RepID=A0ABU2BBE7_9CORY|nr:hypothetical protein [Corynebacterium felinum]MDF5819900.1 hypothetical protein [Corynebacterium felinum]MDR7355957.1 hypothetical protein [Corynebacterium felinum]